MTDTTLTTIGKMKTEFKYTPGPWKMGEIYKEDIFQVLQDGSIDVPAWIATLPKFTDDEKFANAKLIAAAPELLEALQELWPLATNAFNEMSTEEINSDPYLKRLSDCMDKAIAVINKATL